jgi:hypothetical protein
MKVRCIKLLDVFGNPQEESPWLTLGKIYHVLEVVQDTDRKWFFRIVGDGLNGVALFPLEEFEILTAKIPHTWIVVWGRDGFFELSPEPWSKLGFWEAYYDRSPDAARVFEEEKRKTIDADP